MHWVTELPRLARIIISAIFGLMVTALLTPLVDGIYMNNFFNAQTVMLPALVSTGVGIFVYLIGWRVFVGYVGEQPRFTRALLAYLAFGVFVTVFALTLFVLSLLRR